jgi:hypothetical protein
MRIGVGRVVESLLGEKGRLTDSRLVADEGGLTARSAMRRLHLPWCSRVGYQQWSACTPDLSAHSDFTNYFQRPGAAIQGIMSSLRRLNFQTFHARARGREVGRKPIAAMPGADTWRVNSGLAAHERCVK